MKMAFFLNEYRPYGGLPRDCLKLAREAVARGHEVTIVTRVWKGDVEKEALEQGIQVDLLGNHGLTNAGRDRAFVHQAQQWLATHPTDLTLGFFRMSGMDAYFAADPCYEAKVRRLKPAWFRQTPRYRRFARAEASVFARGNGTLVFLLHPGERETYQEIYGTEPDRLRVLPPGIQRPEPQDREEARKSIREELGLPATCPLLLLAGSGFRTKGLDRALEALAALQDQETQLVIAGEDHAAPFQNLAKKLGVAERTHFLGGRSDLSRWMFGSDLLVHPAYSENTGTVLLEAIVRGLPVVASGVCGFAYHLERSQAGIALQEPFSQSAFVNGINELLGDTHRHQQMRRAGSQYGVSEDLYSCHQRAVNWLEELGRSHHEAAEPR